MVGIGSAHAKSAVSALGYSLGMCGGPRLVLPPPCLVSDSEPRVVESWVAIVKALRPSLPDLHMASVGNYVWPPIDLLRPKPASVRALVPLFFGPGVN